MTEPKDQMSFLDDLTTKIAAAPNLERSIELLLGDLAERVKATSNDTNIQRLAREIMGAAPGLVTAIADKPAKATREQTL